MNPQTLELNKAEAWQACKDGGLSRDAYEQEIAMNFKYTGPNRRIEFVRLTPTGHGWNARVVRKHRSAHPRYQEYFNLSQASIERFQQILNSDEQPSFHIELGRNAFRCEIELYPK